MKKLLLSSALVLSSMCNAVPFSVPHHIRAHRPLKHSHSNDGMETLKKADNDYILYLAWAGLAVFAGYSIYQMYRMLKERAKKWHAEDLVQE